MKNISGLFKFVSFIFVIALVGILLHTIKLLKIRNYWHETEGVVVKKSSKGWWDDERNRRYYLEYEYEVDGVKFKNVKFHPKEESIKKYTYLLRKYKKGDSIKVFYNPHKPHESFINVEYLRNSFLLFFIITSFIVMLITMMLKEKRAAIHVAQMFSKTPLKYNGQMPLPTSDILIDEGRFISINTGKSIFWSFGVPFLFFSFVSLFLLIQFLSEINYGWTLSDYLILIIFLWWVCAATSLIFKKGFRYTLDIDSVKGEIRELVRLFFLKKSRVSRFSDIKQVVLTGDTWRKTNTLKNWILFIETRQAGSFFISFRHRDIQPSGVNYLNAIKIRLDKVFGLN